jgi:hypothetical protein
VKLNWPFRCRLDEGEGFCNEGSVICDFGHLGLLKASLVKLYGVDGSTDLEILLEI